MSKENSFPRIIFENESGREVKAYFLSPRTTENNSAACNENRLRWAFTPCGNTKHSGVVCGAQETVELDASSPSSAVPVPFAP